MKIDWSSYKERYKPQIDQLMQRLKPVQDYWMRMPPRDQQILIIAGILMAIMMVMFVISGAISFKNSLRDDYKGMEGQKFDAQIIAKQYKALSVVTPNDFSSVNSERIKGDITQVMDAKDPQVTLADNTLTIKIDNVKFESVMQFLDQMRKSYGLFPDKLKITRATQSGYVNVNIVVNNVE